MPFNVSNAAFEEAFGNPKTQGKLTRSFIQQLTRYLENKNFDSAKAIRIWLQKGGTLSTFTCREDMLQAMMMELRRHKTPYILVKETGGGLGFLIRSSDTELVKKIIRHVLKEKSRFCAVTTGQQASDLYLKSKEKDKTMLQVCGLSEEEVIYLEQACNTVLPGEAVGIDRMADGTYMFSCHGKTAVNGKKRRKSFGSALAESLMVMNGSTSEKMKKRAQNVAAYREAKAAGFPDQNGGFDSPVWIVGDGDRFVKTAGSGFELGHAIEIGDSVILGTDLTVAKDDEAYGSRLNAALSHILGRICLYTEDDVIAHFKTKRSYMQDQTVVGEQQLLMLADAMIAEKIKQDTITHMDGKWEHKFRHYQHEMGRLMVGVRDAKIPKGYSREDILQLRKVSKTFNLDMMKLTPAIEKLLQIDVYARDAGQNKVTNIENTIAKYRGEQGIEGPTEPDRNGLDRG